MSILRRYVEDQISTNFHVIFTYFFDVISLIEKSTLFQCTFCEVISLIEKCTLFPRTFFGVISLVEKFALFPRTSLAVISLFEISTFFPVYLFRCNFDGRKIHVVSTYLFRCNFNGPKIHKILMGKSSTSFLVKLQANENIRGGFFG